MVAGLVEQEEIGGPGQQPGERQPAELVGGERADRNRQVGRAEQSVRQKQFGPLVLGQGEPPSEAGQQPLLPAPDGDVLGEVPDPSGTSDVARVGVDGPGHDP